MQNRRQTLATISSNAAAGRESAIGRESLKPNALKRQSVAPGRLSVMGRPSLGNSSNNGRSSLGRSRNSLGGRKSINPPRQSIGRRSSVFGTKAKITEPRPLGDKNYQLKNIRTLITFLTSRHYDSPISPKTLNSPSRKDFQQIAEFLVRQMDPTFIFTDGKFEEEFTQLLKSLGYPTNISKQALVAVGTPHTWPSVCAALVWIIELIMMDQDDGKEDDIEPAGSRNSDSGLLFEYLVQSYDQFLAGEDNNSALEQQLADTFQARNQVVNEDIERFRMRNESLKKEITNLKSTANTVAGLQSRRADLNMDLTKFTQLVKKLEDHRQALEATIAAQEFSPLEVQRMHQERSLLTDSLAAIQQQKEETQHRIWELEKAIARKLDESSRHVHEYNEKAVQLQLIPSSAKLAGGVEFELHFNPHAATSEAMASVDLKGTIKPALMALKEEFADKTRAAMEEQREAAEKAEQLRYVKNEKDSEVADLKSRLKKIETAFHVERESMNKELKEAVAQVEDTELEVHRLRAVSTNALMQAEKKIQQLATEKQLLEQQCVDEAEKYSEEICTTMDAITKAKMQVDRVLEDLAKKAQATRDTMSSMTLTQPPSSILAGVGKR